MKGPGRAGTAGRRADALYEAPFEDFTKLRNELIEEGRDRIVLVARVTGQITTAGYTPLMLVLLLSTFTIMFGLGVVGSYVWRTYENSKGRPPTIVMSHQTFEATSESPVKRDAGASDAAG